MNLPMYIHLKPGEALPQLGLASPFKAVLVVESDAAPEWQDTVANWLVQSGCRYAMAWGQSCAAWHDSVDLANVRAFNCEEIPNDDFIFTTWHDQEELTDVFWFCENAAAHPTLSLIESYIIHIAQNERRNDLLEMFRLAQDMVEE